MCVGARKSAMRTCKSIAECLADEVISCAKNDNGSWCIQKKIEVEKNAKANR
jgi:small subunit ribosomal protein S5e